MMETNVSNRGWWYVPAIFTALAVPTGFFAYAVWMLSGVGELPCDFDSEWTHACREEELARDVSLWFLLGLPVAVVLLWVWPPTARFNDVRWAVAVVTLLCPVIVFIAVTAPSY